MSNQNKINYFGFSIPNWYRHSRNLNNEQKGILITAIICFMEDDPYAIADATVLLRYNQSIDDLTFYKNNSIKNSQKQRDKANKRWKTHATGDAAAYAGGMPNVNVNVNDNIKDKEYIDYESYLMAWNDFVAKATQRSACNIPYLKYISEKRKNKIKCRVNKNGLCLDDFKVVLDKVYNCNFLLGHNNNKWVITFDWLIENDNNMAKILEGNYDSK